MCNNNVFKNNFCRMYTNYFEVNTQTNLIWNQP